MKYLLIVLLVCSSGYIGKLFSDKYKKRVKIYSTLIKFAEFLKLNIYSLQENIVIIFDKFISQNQSIGNDFDKIKQIVINNKTSVYDFRKIKLFNELKSGEIEDVKDFFNLLGKNNLDLQISLIDNYLHIFKLKLEECNIDQKQKGNISYKLSLSLGVMIAIMVL